MAKRWADELDLEWAGPWRREEGTLVRWTLRAGGERHELLADEATGKALLGLLAALPATLERLERENRAQKDEVESVTRERDALQKERDGQKRRTQREPASAPRAERAKGSGGAPSLADVPLDMIGTFTLTPEVKRAAKDDPLLALAVQVAKASEPDASPLEQARLRAMATAVSRGDLDTFWAASSERSKKKLGL